MPSTTEIAIAKFTAELPWKLDDFQLEALHQLERHQALLVSAPTSSGKTLVAEYAIWRCIKDGQPGRVIYTTPLKALSNQKYHDLCQKYGSDQVGLVTGEHTVNDRAAVVVMTTEILRNIIYAEPGRLDLVSEVILDEIHYIDDYPRGTVWEEIIIEAPTHIKIIGLSATISNVEEIAEWMRGLRGDVATVVRIQRPVPLKLWLAVRNNFYPLLDKNGKVNSHTMELVAKEEPQDSRQRYLRRTKGNELSKVISLLVDKQMVPAIYFIFSRRGCRDALTYCAVHGMDLTTSQEKNLIRQRWKSLRAKIQDPDEQVIFDASLSADLLVKGVAMHHAGMLPAAKEAVELVFAEGLIKAVFATETLSLGLNMPARACVVSTFTKFDGTGFNLLSSSELTQLMGRAGRRGIDTVGHGIILKDEDVEIEDIYYAALHGEAEVISKFAPTYTMVLNLLNTRSLEQAELLVERSLGQFQAVNKFKQWLGREKELRQREIELQRQHFQHPKYTCSEKTLSQHLFLENEIKQVRAGLSKIRSGQRAEFRGPRHNRRYADPGGRYETQRRKLKKLQGRQHQSFCGNCRYFSAHLKQRNELSSILETLVNGEDELREAQHRYRNQFRALNAILHQTGFLVAEKPTVLGNLASSLYGDTSLPIAIAIQEGWLDQLSPVELAAGLVMLVSESRGPDRNFRPRFPTDAVADVAKHFDKTLYQLAILERQHDLDTVRSLSFDYVLVTYDWAKGIPLMELELPKDNDMGDVIKAIKNVYSVLRQLEMTLREHSLQSLVRHARQQLERDLIRRI